MNPGARDECILHKTRVATHEGKHRENARAIINSVVSVPETDKN